MRTQSTIAADSAIALSHAPVCDHDDDVVTVTAEPNFRLLVKFGDGTSGLVNMEPLVHANDAGVFTELADEALFSQAFVSMGAVTWPSGQDLAPDAMYEAFRRDGSWTPR